MWFISSLLPRAHVQGVKSVIVVSKNWQWTECCMPPHTRKSQKLSLVCFKSLRMAHKHYKSCVSPAMPIDHTYRCNVLFLLCRIVHLTECSMPPNSRKSRKIIFKSLRMVHEHYKSCVLTGHTYRPHPPMPCAVSIAHARCQNR